MSIKRSQIIGWLANKCLPALLGDLVVKRNESLTRALLVRHLDWIRVISVALRCFYLRISSCLPTWILYFPAAWETRWWSHPTWSCRPTRLLLNQIVCRQLRNSAWLLLLWASLAIAVSLLLFFLLQLVLLGCGHGSLISLLILLPLILIRSFFVPNLLVARKLSRKVLVVWLNLLQVRLGLLIQVVLRIKWSLLASSFQLLLIQLKMSPIKIWSFFTLVVACDSNRWKLLLLNLFLLLHWLWLRIWLFG